MEDNFPPLLQNPKPSTTMNKRRRLTKPTTISSTQTQNNNIPQSLLIHEIFPKLPVKTLLRFKSLSKQWHSIISSPNFTQSHLSHHSQIRYLLIDFRGNLHIHDNGDKLRSFNGEIQTNFSAKFTQPIGSSNGLVCSLHGPDYYFLWNPSTTLFRRISLSSNLLSHCGRNCRTFRGFGYVSSIDDYKLVEASFDNSKSQVNLFEMSIFTLKTGVWRHMMIPDKPNVLICCGIDSSMRFDIKPGTALVNETLHWLGFAFYCGVMVESLVLAFNLVKEEMISLSTPSSVIPANMSKGDAFLSVVDECLCLCNLYHNHGLVEMWVLDDYGDRGSWRKLIKVELGMGLVGSKLPNWNLFGGFEKKIMVRPSGGNPHLFVDLSFDPPKMVYLPKEMYLSFAISYVESLVSPFPPSENDGRTSFNTICQPF